MAINAGRSQSHVNRLGSVLLAGWAFLFTSCTESRGYSLFQAEAVGALRQIAYGQSEYASRCAAGGYATDLADLLKPPTDPNLSAHEGGQHYFPRVGFKEGFVSEDLKPLDDGSLKHHHIITIVRNASPNTTAVGSPAKTCNGSKSQPASSYFASANPLPAFARRYPYMAIDERGTIFYSRTAPVPNPIPPDALVLQ